MSELLTTLAFIVIWKYWKWPIWAAAALMVPALLIDLIFLGANLLKVFSGGWVPLLIGGMVMVVMLTWRRGARILAAAPRVGPGSVGRRIRGLRNDVRTPSSRCIRRSCGRTTCPPARVVPWSAAATTARRPR